MLITFPSFQSSAYVSSLMHIVYFSAYTLPFATIAQSSSCSNVKLSETNLFWK